MIRIGPDGQDCARAANGASTAPATTVRLVSLGISIPWGSLLVARSIAPPRRLPRPHIVLIASCDPKSNDRGLLSRLGFGLLRTARAPAISRNRSNHERAISKTTAGRTSSPPTSSRSMRITSARFRSAPMPRCWRSTSTNASMRAGRSRRSNSPRPIRIPAANTPMPRSSRPSACSPRRARRACRSSIRPATRARRAARVSSPPPSATGRRSIPTTMRSGRSSSRRPATSSSPSSAPACSSARR